jgi:hypothetical protein
MIHVYLKNNVVADIARVDPFSIFRPDYAAQFIPAPDEVTHGWTYADGVFSAPVPTPEPVVIPSPVSMRQARLALLQAGKLADVGAAIAALPSPAKEAAQIEWEYAIEVKRDSQLVIQLAPALGLDDAALDALFTQAATL